MRRPKLLLAFGLMALVPVLALGFALSTTLKGVIRERALKDVRYSATFVASIGVPAYVPAKSIERGLTHEQIDLLGTVIESGATGQSLAGMEIRDSGGRIVFSDKRSSIGTRAPSTEFRSALSGKVVSRVTRARGAKAFAVSVPLQYPGRSSRSGVVTVYVPYAAIAGNIAHDTRKLYLILAAGLGLLYLLLFPVVARASNALRRQAAEHEHLAHHDALTGLANRMLFSRRLERTLSEERPFCVMIIDLDRFKTVNDRFGHPHGDAVLRSVAGRLLESVRSTDTVARLGGDEFGVLLPGLERELSEQVARRITDALALPTVVGGKPVRTPASIGIAVAPEHGGDVDTLLHAADFAMYAAKETRGGYRVAGPAPVPSAPLPGPRAVSA